MKKKILAITPHLSTGGCPQYLLKKIETYKDEFDFTVVEYSNISPVYVVQKNRIKNLIGELNVITLEEDKHELLDVIERIQPDIIHFEEISESFVEFSLLKKIYNPDRDYSIAETTHSSESNPDKKYFAPDKFVFVTEYSKAVFSKLKIDSEIWEYPIEKKRRPNRKAALEKLGLDPFKVHILNVGLFTPGKNQGELFKIAKQLDDKYVFHFVGNQAGNFADYWKPLMDDKPNNCIVWGEKDNVDDFLSACDLFYFSSVFELNPLVLKEALSWNMKILLYDLPTYLGKYESEKNMTFLEKSSDLTKKTEAVVKLTSPISKKLEKLAIDKHRTKIVHILSLNDDIEKQSIESISQLASPNTEYTIHFNPPAKFIPPDRKSLHPQAQGGGSLKPGHFGCFDAFRKAITEDFTNDYDFLIVCERDCLIEKPIKEIQHLLSKTYDVMKDQDIFLFSFGDKVDLDHGNLQSTEIEKIEDFAYTTDKIIGLQFIVVSRKGRDFLDVAFEKKGWYGMDIWFNTIFKEAGKHFGILNERATTQMDGFSIIDQEDKKFKMNDKD